MPSTPNHLIEYPDGSSTYPEVDWWEDLADSVEDALNLLFPNNNAWQSYTPALTAATTNPTLGTGSSVSGRWIQIGKTVHAKITITFGTSGVNAGSGAYFVSLPTAPSSNVAANDSIGGGHGIDASAPAAAVIDVSKESSSTARMRITGSSPSLSNNSPWTWAANDRIHLHLTYEVD